MRADGIRDALSRDDRVHVLADRRRRYVLYRMKESGAPMAVADLADDLVRRVTERSPTAVQEQRERIYTSLYHNHLPKLAEADLVRFDVDRKVVRLSPEAAELQLNDPR